jgi:hypothetical protein
VDRDRDLVATAIDFDFVDSSFAKSAAKEFANLDVLAQVGLVVGAAEPLRIPAIDRADAEDFRIDFVSHITSSSRRLS